MPGAPSLGTANSSGLFILLLSNTLQVEGYRRRMLRQHQKQWGGTGTDDLTPTWRALWEFHFCRALVWCWDWLLAVPPSAQGLSCLWGKTQLSRAQMCNLCSGLFMKSIRKVWNTRWPNIMRGKRRKSTDSRVIVEKVNNSSSVVQEEKQWFKTIRFLRFKTPRKKQTNNKNQNPRIRRWQLSNIEDNARHVGGSLFPCMAGAHCGTAGHMEHLFENGSW